MADEPISVLILAGGRSKRMGRDKAWLEIDGQPLVERVARRVLPLASEIIFSAATAEPFLELSRSLPVPARVVPDEHPGAGPLAGLHSGIDAARHDLVVALATDLPLVNLPLLKHMVTLIDGNDALVPLVPSRRTGEPMKEPLHALYRHSCLPAIAAHLSSGDFVAYGFLPDVRTRFVLPEEMRPLDPDLLSFMNVNTPEDWDAALRTISSRQHLDY